MISASPTRYEELSIEEAARVDAICDSFEQAWKEFSAGGELPSVAGCAGGGLESETALHGVLIRELIALDRAYRQRYGVPIRSDDYAALGVTDDTDGPGDTPGGVSGADSSSVEQWPSIPGLELMEVIGWGGMGVVFRARQAALDREVAVKILRDVPLGDLGLRERFAQEARAIARLQHPHLVQVYDFGEVPGAGPAGSQSYLVLEFISGGSLAEKFHHAPQRPTEAARLVEILADAIQFAHQQGVIHRDLKPSNILLTSAGADDRASPADESAASGPPSTSPALQPKITDFGLAKFETGGDLTRTGDVLGTPSYMAPEQTTGKSGSVTAAVDVYGLGAILYEALSGRPPFQAETAVATVVQVQQDEPIQPRRLQPTVPRDLEVICLKCLRKEPRQRYATARELGDDLRRFQNGEPIRARPLGPGERVVRWCRRKPLAAALLAALVLVFAAGLSGVLWQWSRATELAVVAEKNASDFKRERDVARREQDRAERHLQRVRSKVDRLAQLGRDLWQDARLYKTGETVLEEALAFYQEILPEEGQDPRVRLETARLYHQVADIEHTLGQWEKSVESFDQEAKLLEGLLAEEPDNTSYRRQLANCHRFRGIALADLADESEARKAYDRAIEQYELLTSRFPNEMDLKLELGNVLLNKAVLLSPENHAAEIEQLYQRLFKIEQAASFTLPQSAYYQGELTLALEGRAAFYLATGRPEKALPLHRRVLSMREELLGGSQQERLAVHYLARAHANVGDALAALDQKEEAEQAYQESLKLLEQAVKDFPDTPQYRIDLAKTLCALANVIQDPSREEAADYRQRAIGLYEKQVEESPEDIGSRLRLGMLLDESGRHVEAVEQLRKLLEFNPEYIPGVNTLAWSLANSPDLQARDPAEAVRLASKAVATNPEEASYWNTLGAAQYRNGDDDAAKTSLETSIRLRKSGTAHDWFFLAMICCRQGDFGQARTWFDKAASRVDEHTPPTDELHRLRAEAEALLADAPAP